MTAALRQEAYRSVAAAGGDLDARRRVGRACAYHGAAELHPDMRPWLDAARLDALRAAALERCRMRFPQAPVRTSSGCSRRGISGQTRYQNNTMSPFSYAVLDGFAVPLPLVQVFDRPRDVALARSSSSPTAISSPGPQPHLAAWEAAFAEVERVDPEKIDALSLGQGQHGRMRTDDRTVVIVEL